jgi:hypothetical protein
MSPYTIRDRFRVHCVRLVTGYTAVWQVREHGEQGTRVVASYSGIGAEQSARLRAEELNARESE